MAVCRKAVSKPRTTGPESSHVTTAVADKDLDGIAGGHSALSADTPRRNAAAANRRAGYEIHGFINTDDPTDP
jgi:hypothetical protein